MNEYIFVLRSRQICLRTNSYADPNHHYNTNLNSHMSQLSSQRRANSAATRREPKIWRHETFVQACGLVCSGCASIINCPNLVYQGDTISGKLLTLVNAVARRGPGPEDTVLVCEFGTASGAHRPCCTSSRVCRSTCFITSSFDELPLRPRQLQTDSYFFFIRRCNSCIYFSLVIMIASYTSQNSSRDRSWSVAR